MRDVKRWQQVVTSIDSTSTYSQLPQVVLATDYVRVETARGHLQKRCVRYEAENKRLRELIEELRPQHYWCDDSYYSCPCAPDFYGNVDPDAECNCAADATNARVDAALDGFFIGGCNE